MSRRAIPFDFAQGRLGPALYSFLSEYDDKGPSGGNIRYDVANVGRYFKKIRFGITGEFTFDSPDKRAVLYYFAKTDGQSQ